MTLSQRIEKYVEKRAEKYAIESHPNCKIRGSGSLIIHNTKVDYTAGANDLAGIVVQLAEALEFYSCEFNWHSDHDVKCNELSCCHKEKNKRADSALKSLEEMLGREKE